MGLISIIIIFLFIGFVFKFTFSTVGFVLKLVFWILGLVFSIIGWIIGAGLFILLGFVLVGVPLCVFAKR